MYLTLDEQDLKARNSYWTAREICRQPQVWHEAARAVEAGRERTNYWLKPLLAKPNLRMVLSGAGTSAFIGESLAPWLRNKLQRRVEAVSTTDLTGDPGQYLAENLPTLLVSFARSGNSPESVATVDLANQVLDECYHLVLTCNPDGLLAQSAARNDNMLCLLMPEGTNDRGFAMTSSYSSMLVSGAAIFSPGPEQLAQAALLAQKVIDEEVEGIKAHAASGFNRLVVLGAGALLGTAREASLKCLELSAGQVVPMFDSPLGFRHGPKSVVDRNTLIVLLRSAGSYTQLYDEDLLSELQRDGQAGAIVPLSPQSLGATTDMEDIWLSLPYIVYCQMLAFFKALALNITADNPCPGGEVNRVVQGVTIHPYRQEISSR